MAGVTRKPLSGYMPAILASAARGPTGPTRDRVARNVSATRARTQPRTGQLARAAYTDDSWVSGLDMRRDGECSDWARCGTSGLIIGMTSLMWDEMVSLQSVK